MSNVFVLPKQTPLNSSGRVYPGAKAYFYRTGTNTPKAVYSDADHMNPIVQPVQADTGGTFQPIYLDTSDTEYRLTLNTSGDALIYTQDDVGGSLSQEEIDAFLQGNSFFDQTKAEQSAGVTPSNYFIYADNFDPRRYGAVGDGVTDDTLAVQKSFTVAGVGGGTIVLPPDYTFLCTSNITCPVGVGTVVNIRGADWASGGIKFSGAAITTGLNFDGTPYSYCGSVEHLRISCTSGAKRCITFKEVTNPRLERCFLTGAAGCAVKYDTTLMGLMAHTLVTSCGSATEGSVEVVGPLSTTWKWDHSYISGGNTTIGGLLLDSTFQITMIGGAIESSGKPLVIASKADSTYGVGNVLILGVDFENPGTNNPYISIGSGLSGGIFARCIDIQCCNGSPSGTAQVNYAVQMENCLQVELSSNNWALAGTPIATHNMSGTNNFGVQIRAHRNLSGGSTPWLFSNGAQRKSAGPRVDWSSDGGGSQGLSAISSTITGATPSILISTTEGGFYKHIGVSNGGATTMTSLSGGEQGMEVTLFPSDGNTTLQHTTVTGNGFNMISGANVTMGSGKAYKFVHTGQLWLQV